jgi:hypothetical protein
MAGISVSLSISSASNLITEACCWEASLLSTRVARSWWLAKMHVYKGPRNHGTGIVKSFWIQIEPLPTLFG